MCSRTYCYVFLGLWDALWFSGFCFTNFFSFLRDRVNSQAAKTNSTVVLYGSIGLKSPPGEIPHFNLPEPCWSVCLPSVLLVTLLSVTTSSDKWAPEFSRGTHSDHANLYCWLPPPPSHLNISILKVWSSASVGGSNELLMVGFNLLTAKIYNIMTDGLCVRRVRSCSNMMNVDTCKRPCVYTSMKSINVCFFASSHSSQSGFIFIQAVKTNVCFAL